MNKMTKEDALEFWKSIIGWVDAERRLFGEENISGEFIGDSQTVELQMVQQTKLKTCIEFFSKVSGWVPHAEYKQVKVCEIPGYSCSLIWEEQWTLTEVLA
jgi:hypothetical protein